MRARTPDEFSEFIRDDLAWRRKENKVLQSAVRTAEASKKQALLRGAVAALYAHWEGFVKTACRVYLEFVKMRGLQYRELSIPLLSITIQHRLSALGGSQRLDSHREFCDWLLREWARRAKWPDPNDAIATSNLNAEVFRSLINGLGLPYTPDYERAEKPVIDALVRMRNNLAHGAWQVVEESQYDELYMWIDRLMEDICDRVENPVVTGAYRRSLTQLV